jgi:hypothetical protein
MTVDAACESIIAGFKVMFLIILPMLGLARLMELYLTRRKVRDEKTALDVTTELRAWQSEVAVRQHRLRSPGCACGRCQEWSSVRSPSPPDILPDSRVLTIEPRDESDPFGTCPKCKLAGTHGLAPVEANAGWTRMTHPVLQRTIDVAKSAVPEHTRSGWVEVGAWAAQRTCVFCGHRWRTSPAPAGPIVGAPDRPQALDRPQSESTCRTCGAEGLWAYSCYSPPSGHEIVPDPAIGGFRLRCPKVRRAEECQARAAELTAKTEQADETLTKLSQRLLDEQAVRDLIGPGDS